MTTSTDPRADDYIGRLPVSQQGICQRRVSRGGMAPAAGIMATT